MVKLQDYLGIRAWKRHGLVLLIIGMVYVLIGVSLILTDPSKTRTTALKLALDWMSFQGWGYVFIFVGAMSILSSRWPPVSETWGYTLLTALSGLWAFFYLAGVVFLGTNLQNLTQFLTWSIIAFMWWAISGLVNPGDETNVLLVEIEALKSEIRVLQDREG